MLLAVQEFFLDATLTLTYPTLPHSRHNGYTTLTFDKIKARSTTFVAITLLPL